MVISKLKKFFFPKIITPKPLNVILHKEVLIQSFSELIKNGFFNLNKIDDYSKKVGEVILPFIGKIITEIDSKDLDKKVYSYELITLEKCLYYPNFNSFDNNLVIEYNIEPKIKGEIKVLNSFLCGHNVLNGDSRSMEKKEFFDFFMEFQDKIISRKPDSFFEVLNEFAKLLDEKEFERSSKHTKDKDYHLLGYYDDLFRIIFKDFKDIRNEVIYNIHRYIYIWDCLEHELIELNDLYNIFVNNSILVGYNLGNKIKGGEIRNSILVARNYFENTNLKIVNSYIISKSGVKYIEEEILGNPTDYQNIPQKLIDIFSPNPYIDPHILAKFFIGARIYDLYTSTIKRNRKI